MNRALFSLVRGQHTEITFTGEISVSGSSPDFSTSELQIGYPARSLIKPFQFLAAGLSRQDGIGEKRARYAACTGSISATEAQVEWLERWYSDSDSQLKISKMRLAPSYPMDDSHRVHLKEAGKKAEKILHTCFSKHMAILESCVINGWSLDDYCSTSHPYHRRLMTTLSFLLGEELSEVCIDDGCLLPSPVLTLRQMAKLFQQLANPKKEGRLKEIRDLMLSEPEWVGGPSRFDTRLMQQNSGKVIAKEGADGLLGLAVLPSAKFPEGLGIVVKSLSGYQPALTALSLTPLLTILGLAQVAEAPKGQVCRYHYTPFQNHRAMFDLSPLISERIANWPGDVPFTREVNFDAAKGNHLTLSSIRTSVHLGTHTDAPNHASGTAFGIESAEPSRYLGPCQVVSVKKKRGSLIEKTDIENLTISAPRLLVRTGSFPDPNSFNKDFVAFSSDSIEWLADRGVLLIGIDTPSIDAFDSKTLPAHHATVALGLSILEGVILTGVKDGLYEICSLPLKIENADASPVRAVLAPLSGISPD